jgi:hypothetical protein
MGDLNEQRGGVADASCCDEGGLEGVLNCTYDKDLARFFLWNQMPSLALMLLGTALAGAITGAWWPLIVLVAGTVALWGLGVETRLLCTHCPFYGAEGKTLRCLALDGFPKWWRYRPGPMSQWEKAVLSVFVVWLLLFPVAVQGYATWMLWSKDGATVALWGMALVTLATILTEAQFLYVIRHDFCARCVNFSCPLNSVPKALVDAYLQQNPVMREAWERSGYRPGG